MIYGQHFQKRNHCELRLDEQCTDLIPDLIDSSSRFSEAAELSVVMTRETDQCHGTLQEEEC
jgi:hypothetical protein